MAGQNLTEAGSGWNPSNYRPGRVTITEGMILAVVLGITAWVVVPRLSQAVDSHAADRLSVETQALRAQIERYRVEHGGAYPDAGRFVEQMTGPTRPDGTPCAADADGVVRGPYLYEIPINPLTGGNNVVAIGTGGEADAPTDWRYDQATGRIRPLVAVGPDTR